MPKVAVFSILWGVFWDSVFLGGSGMYVLPPVLAAAFLVYSPFIIKTLNIFIVGIGTWFLMTLWSLMAAGFIMPSAAFMLHLFFYIIFSLIFTSLIYVWETKKQN